MAAVAASSVPIGKMTIRYPSSVSRAKADRRGLAPSAQLNSSAHAGEGAGRLLDLGLARRAPR